MGNSKKRPGDITGRKAEMLAAENKEALKARAAEISLMNEAEEAAKSEVVSLVPERRDVEQGTVRVEVPFKTIRVNSTLEHMTFGHGSDYTFEEGRTYKVPREVADHLEEKGYVWH
jgi:hypothetical protein